MQNWLSLVLDTAPIQEIYGEEIPTLDGINLHEIDLHRDGPSISLRFDLRQFPKNPPQKWKATGFNRTQLILVGSGIHELEILGFKKEIICDLHITKEKGLTRLFAQDDAMKIAAEVDFLFIQKIAAYYDAGIF